MPPALDDGITKPDAKGAANDTTNETCIVIVIQIFIIFPSNSLFAQFRYGSKQQHRRWEVTIEVRRELIVLAMNVAPWRCCDVVSKREQKSFARLSAARF